MVERQGRGVGEERPARGGGGWTRRIWRVDFWPGRSSRRWISRRCSAPPRDSLSGRWSCRCWMPGPGSNGPRAGPGRRRTRSREVCSSGRYSRRTRRWPGGRSRTLARPRRRASPMHGERPQSATQNGHAYSTYRIVQIQMARGKPPIPKGRSRIYLQRVAERLKAKRRNFDPISLRLRRWKSSRRVPRSRRFASFDSLAPPRAVPPCLRSSGARRARRWEGEEGRKSWVVLWSKRSTNPFSACKPRDRDEKGAKIPGVKHRCWKSFAPFLRKRAAGWGSPPFLSRRPRSKFHRARRPVTPRWELKSTRAKLFQVPRGGERCIPRPLLPSGSAGVRGNAIYAFPTFHSSIECGRMCKRREVERRGNSTAGERVDRINFPFVRIMEM